MCMSGAALVLVTLVPVLVPEVNTNSRRWAAQTSVVPYDAVSVCFCDMR